MSLVAMVFLCIEGTETYQGRRRACYEAPIACAFGERSFLEAHTGRQVVRLAALALIVAQDSLLSVFGELSATLDNLADDVMGVQFTSALPKV